MEFAVREEVKKFTDLIDKRLEQSKTNSTTSTDLNIELGIAVVNSLWSILTGEQIDHGDRRVSPLIYLNQKNFALGAHLRNKKFLLKFLSQPNASKFAIFYI